MLLWFGSCVCLCGDNNTVWAALEAIIWQGWTQRNYSPVPWGNYLIIPKQSEKLQAFLKEPHQGAQILSRKPMHARVELRLIICFSRFPTCKLLKMSVMKPPISSFTRRLLTDVHINFHYRMLWAEMDTKYKVKQHHNCQQLCQSFVGGANKEAGSIWVI